MLMGEFATAHPDGTVSLLRCGINGSKGYQTPIPFSGMLLVRIESDAADLGSHQYDVRCMDEDGKQVMPPLAGTFTTPEGGGINNFVLGLGMAFPTPGKYAFYVRVDNVELDRWPMKAMLVDKPDQSPPGGPDLSRR
jgi:hypothetical protein